MNKENSFMWKRVWVALLVLAACAETAIAVPGPWDVDVGDWPRGAGEAGDSARIRRAIDAAGEGGVVWFPRGEYAIDEMLVVSNRTSLLLHKSARLRAVREMPFVLRYFGGMDGAWRPGMDHNLFFRGGEIDGAGLASCANFSGLRHFTLADATFRNGRAVGVRLGYPELAARLTAGYEIMAYNLYLVCDRPGLAGNVGFETYIGDSHFTDLVVVDYTVGIRDRKWANRYTRCHVWGGPVKRAGTDESEMLPGSVAFDLLGADTLLDNCYADTAQIGFNVVGGPFGAGTRIVNCGYYNNVRYGLEDTLVFNHQNDFLVVTGGRFTKNGARSTLYARGAKAGRLDWRDNHVLNFAPADTAELRRVLGGRDRPMEGETSDAVLSAPGM